MCPWEAMGGGDYNRNLLYPIGGVEVVEMVEMMEIVPRNKYTRHPKWRCVLILSI